MPDDTEIFSKVTSIDDSKKLQKDIDSLNCWSDKWLLKFNTDKCHVLTMEKFENITGTLCMKMSLIMFSRKMIWVS